MGITETHKDHWICNSRIVCCDVAKRQCEMDQYDCGDGHGFPGDCFFINS